MGYLIYGKTAKYKKFAALNSRGQRVSQLSDAMEYATKEDAQEIINKYGRSDATFSIRKAPQIWKT